MKEAQNRNKMAKSKDILVVGRKDIRPSSHKIKFNENKIKSIISSIKMSYKNKIQNLRYSSDKVRINKDETKLAKILMSGKNKINFSLATSKFLRLNKEKDYRKLILDDKIKINSIEEKIKHCKVIKEKNQNEIKEAKQNNVLIKETITQKDKEIEEIKKKINEYKKLNDDLINKINNINNSLDSQRNDLSNNINRNTTRERENAMNYLLSLIMDVRSQMNQIPYGSNDYPNVDNMTYEELLALEEKIGNVSKGLSEDEVKKLPREKFMKYKYLEDKCIICQYDFKELENVLVLPCKHCYHINCIKPWLQNQNTCPYCKASIKK